MSISVFDELVRRAEPLGGNLAARITDLRVIWTLAEKRAGSGDTRIPNVLELRTRLFDLEKEIEIRESLRTPDIEQRQIEADRLAAAAIQALANR